MVHLVLSSYVPQTADARPVRVATYNIEFGTGPVGSDKYNAIRSTLARIDADIVCFQELWPDTFAAWEVKRAARVQSADLRSLKAFREDYPEAKLELLYLGKDRLEIDGIAITPCETFLRQLVVPHYRNRTDAP